MLKNGQDKVRATSPDGTAVPKGDGIIGGATYFAKGGDRFLLMRNGADAKLTNWPDTSKMQLFLHQVQV